MTIVPLTEMRKKRKKALPPRAKRMKRKGRLQSARTWLPTYPGNNIVAGYRKQFGVDWLCALKELEILGVKIDPRYKEQLLRTVVEGIEARKRRKARRGEAERFAEHDENFAYIAGYTEAGFPLGLTWEELRADATMPTEEKDEECEIHDLNEIFNSLPERNFGEEDDIPF